MGANHLAIKGLMRDGYRAGKYPLNEHPHNICFCHPYTNEDSTRILARILASYRQKLFETVLYASFVDGEESSSNLVDGFSQAVDVITVACRGHKNTMLKAGLSFCLTNIVWG